MKVIGKFDSKPYGITKGKEYECIFEHQTVYEVEVDSGVLMCRPKGFFMTQEEFIVEKCADISLYDDDEFTPPENVPDFSDEDFWNWIQKLLRASAMNALGMLADKEGESNGR